MKVKDLSGKTHTWKLAGNLPQSDDTRPRSEGHVKCRELLHSIFPTFLILEEVPLPGMGLFFDFYIPMACLAIEIHGQQHYKYSQHFHGSKSNFIKALENDRNKVKWCELNDIRIVILNDTESIDEWRSKITQRSAKES